MHFNNLEYSEDHSKRNKKKTKAEAAFACHLLGLDGNDVP
jgi:hypothetical protein